MTAQTKTGTRQSYWTRFHNWLRRFTFILEVAHLSPVAPECYSDGRKGTKRLVSVDVSTGNGAKIWSIQADGTLAELKNIGKPVKGKITLEVAEGEEVFVAKSLAEAVKMCNQMGVIG